MADTNKITRAIHYPSDNLLLANAIHIQKAASELELGNLVGMPTETVYGLAADAENTQALAKLFACKGRPADHPVIVHVDKACDLSYWAADISPLAQILIKTFWPGPLTLILPRAAHVSDWVTGAQTTIGLRCPAHPVAQALIQAFAKIKNNTNVGLAAPSANRFGKVSPTQAQHVIDEFKDEIIVLDGGACEIGIESTIVDLSRDQAIVLRPGKIREEEIAAVVKQYQSNKNQTFNEKSKAFDNLIKNYLQRDNQFNEADSKAVSQTNIQTDSQTTNQTDNQTNIDKDKLKIKLNLDAPRVAGTLAAHYAPNTPVKILNGSAIYLAMQTNLDGNDSSKNSTHYHSNSLGSFRKIAIIASCQVLARLSKIKLPKEIVIIQAPNTADDYAHQLYALLRRVDQLEVEQIWIEELPDTAVWKAVNDRIQRAAASF